MNTSHFLRRSQGFAWNLALASVASVVVCGPSASATSSDPVARATAIVAKMTLAQKITEMHGTADDGHHRYVPGIASLGIPPLVVTNGPAGVGPGDQGSQLPATALPAPESLAASWDVRQAATYGRIEGSEAADLGNSLLEGTDVNVVRVPQNGRAFENYGEDPYLAGQLAVANIQAVQAQGVVGEVKHFDAYAQETDRAWMNETVDQRTLHEIYDPPFQAAVQQGGAGAVMCAYPKVNTVYNCQNSSLLADTLRARWGFTGFVTSDFGAVHSTIASANAGLNLEMPTGEYFGDALATAVQDGQVSVSTIDKLLVARFATMIRLGLFDHPRHMTPIPAGPDGATARWLAEEGMVLLRNQPVAGHPLLPLNTTTTSSIALIGPYAGAAMTGGGGSSHVKPLYTVTPKAGLAKAFGANTKITYDSGSDPTTAAALAKTASVAIVMVGDSEAEASDRPSLALSGDQDALVQAVSAANPNTIVVVKSGGPVLMPWANKVPAILEAWYPGEEDGNAVADVLTGKFNPSAKLPLTFPLNAGDVPANTPAQFPGVNGTATFSEGVFVGYRHYDQQHLPTQFPFGYGLSYTSFAFSHLAAGNGPNHTVTVTANVTNTGGRYGADIAQLYLGDPSSPTVPEPPNQLQGFTKVRLEPGQTKQVSFTLTPRSFAYWDTHTSSWRITGGTYQINVGDSSRNLPLITTIQLPPSAR